MIIQFSVRVADISQVLYIQYPSNASSGKNVTASSGPNLFTSTGKTFANETVPHGP